MDTIEKAMSCYCCQGPMTVQFEYSSPPAGETQFSFSKSGTYHREFHRCDHCGHAQALTEMDLSEMYSDQYVDSTYGSGGIAKTFERIISLRPEDSDNVGRCSRVDSVTRSHFASVRDNSECGTYRILDVGSGLCVFLCQMKKLGWTGTALDPDPRAVEHARTRVGVEALCGDFFKVEPATVFDVLSLNKVLEHVDEPAAMLRRAADYVAHDGIVYVEVPDGEMAARAGSDREEFFVEHLHAFSMISLALVAQQAGFDVMQMERLQEPSTKFTLRAFLTKR